MKFIIFTGITIGVCISLYGWGLLLHRLAKHPSRNWAVTMTVGLGAIVFSGGALNLLRFAYGWTFDILLLIGAVLAVKYHEFRPESLRKSKSEWFYLAISGLLIAAIMYFTIQTQLPPKAFNCHDDLEKYFAHPVRMLQTGTLFGSPLSALGSETFGGQAVLHGIVLNHFPIPYINGVDAVFGLLLCLLLSISVLSVRMSLLPISLISMLIVFFIDPQYVNVSALYIGSAFMMASIFLTTKVQDDNGETENLPPPVLLGIIYAALIAVKSTFIVFPFLHMGFLIIALAVSGVTIRRLVRWSMLIAISTFSFCLPWLLLHLPHYMLSAFDQISDSGIAAVEEHLNLFSSEPLFYGASFAHYTFTCIVMIIPVLGIVLRRWRNSINCRRHIALAGLAANSSCVVAAFLLIIALGPTINGYEHSLRYTVPFLIAGAPIILSRAYLWAMEDKSFVFKVFFGATALLLGVIILFSFSRSLINRIHQAYESGSILAIPNWATNRNYIKYNEEVIHGDTRLRILAAQRQIPVGQAAIVWIYAPFHLDYKRNVIIDAEPAGIANPWSYMPEADYFLVEYQGPAVRSFEQLLKNTAKSGRSTRRVAKRCIAFMQSLQEIRQNADELYNDGKIVVFKKHGK